MKARTGIFGASFVRGTAAVALCLCAWEIFARTGNVTPLTPSLANIAQTLVRILADGSLATNTLYTLARVLIALTIAIAMAVPLGFLMGRSRFSERFFVPLVSVLLPIPSLAWVPLFVLWFGIGETATICVVIYAASFPLIYNVWAGVRAVHPLWVRAAKVMGARQFDLLRCVVWPGALAYILTGLRLAHGRAWIGVIGGEMLASPVYGLGQMLFNAREFLNASVMMSVLFVIGTIGVVTERFVFGALERVTVRKWGMVAAARG
jgi:NitT/TauT family transport system permease protein